MTKPPAPKGESARARQLALYRLGLTVIGASFRLGPLAAILARASKVFLRHARVRHVLRTGGFDSIVDGGAAVGEFAFAARARARVSRSSASSLTRPRPRSSAETAFASWRLPCGRRPAVSG